MESNIRLKSDIWILLFDESQTKPLEIILLYQFVKVHSIKKRKTDEFIAQQRYKLNKNQVELIYAFKTCELSVILFVNTPSSFHRMIYSKKSSDIMI